MNRILITIVVALLVVAGARTGRAEITGLIGDKKSVDSADNKVVISPSAEPVPALRYQFWPPQDQQQPANAMPYFSRAVLMATTTRLRDRDLFFNADRDDRWLHSKWKPEYADEIREFLSHYDNALAELDRGTNCMRVDYSIVNSSLSIDETYQVMLPEMQEARTLARLLRLRARLEMHSGRWDDFTRTMQTLFRLSEMTGRAGDFLVSRLVGLAIAGMGIETIEEACSLADCPNFYWALAALPDELLEVRGALDHEMQALGNLAPGLAKNPDTPIGAIAARTHLREIIRSVSALSSATGQSSDHDDRSMLLLKGGLVMIANAEQSREYLGTQTRWGDQANELSNSECVLRAFAIEIDRAVSNFLKWTWLPDSIRLQNAERSTEEMRRFIRSADNDFNPAVTVMELFTPAISQVCRSEYRWKQAITQQATIQAIRDFAAKHERLPKSLDELTLPAWPDAISGRPFGYELSSDGTATLTRAPRWSSDEETTSILELTE